MPTSRCSWKIAQPRFAHHQKKTLDGSFFDFIYSSIHFSQFRRHSLHIDGIFSIVGPGVDDFFDREDGVDGAFVGDGEELGEPGVTGEHEGLLVHVEEESHVEGDLVGSVVDVDVVGDDFY